MREGREEGEKEEGKEQGGGRRGGRGGGGGKPHPRSSGISVYEKGGVGGKFQENTYIDINLSFLRYKN